MSVKKCDAIYKDRWSFTYLFLVGDRISFETQCKFQVNSLEKNTPSVKILFHIKFWNKKDFENNDMQKWQTEQFQIDLFYRECNRCLNKIWNSMIPLYLIFSLV